MNKHILLILLPWLYLPVCIQAQTNPTKHALLVGLNDYPDPAWSKIHGADDVEMIKNTLILKGFHSENISTLTNAAATKQGIFKAIRTQLIDRVGKGDHALFLFSGHGQQMKDETPTDEIDGFDESLIPYDAQLQYTAGKYEGQNHIRDDELAYLFKLLREKLGPEGSLWVILDACHSGTATRSHGTARGTTTVMADEAYLQQRKTEQTDHKFSLDYGPNPAQAPVAPMITYSGSAANELNYETWDETGKPVGSLSFAFCKEFVNSGENTTFQALFARIKSRMRLIVHRQTPQMEGAHEQLIFGGKLQDPPQFFLPEKYSPESGQVKLNAGLLSGWSDGCRVVLYPVDRIDITNTEPIAGGIVEKATLTHCFVTLDRPLEKEQVLQTRILLKEKSFAHLSVRVLFDQLPEAMKPLFLDYFKNHPVVSRVWSNPELTIESEVHSNGTEIRLEDATGKSYLNTKWNPHDPKSAIQNIEKAIVNFAQARFLRELVLYDPQMRAELEFIPIECETVYGMLREKSRIPIDSKMSGQQDVCFKVQQDHAKLKITNTGRKGFYFSLLNISSDAKISALLPETGRTIEDYFLQPGTSAELPTIYQFDNPTGMEVLKFILTDYPINLNLLETPEYANTRRLGSPLHPFEELFAATIYRDSEGDATRGLTTPGLPVGSVVVGQVFYNIVD